MSGVDQRANLTESFHISGLSSTKQYYRTMATKARRHEDTKNLKVSDFASSWQPANRY